MGEGNDVAYGMAELILMAEKTEDWQRDETGVATSAEPFAACISISGNGSAESEWGHWLEAHRRV